jgi:hypothetical protein
VALCKCQAQPYAIVMSVMSVMSHNPYNLALKYISYVVFNPSSMSGLAVWLPH